eukprot:jgi/Chlat1/256/Chrsp1S08780
MPATVGPCGDSKPWSWNVVERAKWEGWKQLGQMPAVEAMRLFVRTLEEEQPDWWTKSEALRSPVTPPVANGNAADHHDTAGSAGPSGSSDREQHASLPEGLAAVRTLDCWIAPFLIGRKPTPRYQHASVVVGDKMYVIGGNSFGRYLNDVAVLDLVNLSWSRVDATASQQVSPSSAAGNDTAEKSTTPPLPACAGHDLIAWDGKQILLIGGHSKQPAATVSVRALDTEAMAWSVLDVTGKLPVARGGHTAVRAGSRVILFGGETRDRRLLNDVHVLELNTMTWSALETTGKAPSPRCDHVATVVANRYMFVFGGGSHSVCYNDLHVLDLEDNMWRTPECKGSPPSARAGHASATIGDKWYVVGGGNNATGLTDTVSLDTTSYTWSSVATAPPRTAIASEGLTVAAVPGADGCLVAFGGYNGKYSSDTHVFKPTPVRHASPRQAAVASFAAASVSDSAQQQRIEVNDRTEPATNTTQKEAVASNGHELKLVGDSSSKTAAASQSVEVKPQQVEKRAEQQASGDKAVAVLFEQVSSLTAARDAAQQEVASLRKQLQEARLAAAQSDTDATAARDELASERAKTFRLEVEVAELRQRLTRAETLSRELEVARRREQELTQAAAAQKQSSGGLWNWIAPQPPAGKSSNSEES